LAWQSSARPGGARQGKGLPSGAGIFYGQAKSGTARYTKENMKYFDQYETKWGFNDGDSIPPDAEANWVENMRIMNALLEKHGSDVRLICWYRNGMHNPYLLLHIPRETFDGLDDAYKRGQRCDELECFKGEWDEADTDDGWERAWEDGLDIEFNDATFVDVTVEIDTAGLDKYCALLAAGKTGEDAWRELTGPVCKQCGSVLEKSGFCPDETCPHSDRRQHEEYKEESHGKGT
jgi:hypothetical protein